MPSFDAVSQVDLQEVDNAVNNTKKELDNRYDFRGSKTVIEFNKKEKNIHISTEDTMKMQAITDILMGKAVKRNLDPRCLKFEDVQPGAVGTVKRDIKIREGIEKEMAQKIVKLIKETKLKVQPAIQDDQVRVTGKSIDDLQTVIQMLKAKELEIPLQFVNMKQ